VRESLRELRDAAVRIAAVGIVAADNWWRRALGRGAAWDEGRDTALANAAMVAHDMGRPDIRQAINRLIPDGSPFIPFDDPRHPKNIHVHMRFNDEDPDRAARSFLSELAKVRREGSY
jgi:hypothetical protein